ncbi:phage major capsid protein [Limoniibacter endophyticus]|uniref:Phage capsid protein n=1 Tax=Limoniibacter endophyticus TaxID=1565040 RepID=A0A8J3DPK4_9HYPH|nr:phage major capsid protein [Limoniibacter endophyticus]GHC69337.1 phage capsid protein [Limoniibacter endophyticus]
MQTATTEKAPELKSVETIGQAFSDFMTTFEMFKDANDERLGEIEKRMSADVLTSEKVERISQALDAQKKSLDRLALKNARPALDGGREGADPTRVEHKQAFEAYVRRGDERRLRGIEEKAMSGATGQDGGYLVPEETENAIGARLAKLSPIRSIASVRQVSGAVLKKPFAIGGPAVGWVGETAARPETAAPTLAELQFPTMELYAMPAATASLLDDAVIDLDGWISGEVEQAFAEQEGLAFIMGDGVSQPRGFLDYDQVAETNWSWGKIGTIATGVAGGLPATDPADVLIDTVYALKAGYRQGANWVMNRKAQASLRKMKDGDGNYLWQPPQVAGARASLLGFGVVEAEDMPDMTAGSPAIAFGNFERGYLVVDRVGVRVLRDPYSAKPYVLFYTTKRVGGGVQDFDAIKLLKFEA